MALEWTRTALRNLQDIAEYIAEDNPQRARSFVLELRDKVGLLERHPVLGHVGRIVCTRELVIHKNYLAIYRVHSDEVQILRIHHVAQRIG